MNAKQTPSLIDAARAALKQLAHEVYAVEGRPEEVRNREVRDVLRAAIAAEEAAQAMPKRREPSTWCDDCGVYHVYDEGVLVEKCERVRGTR